MITKFFNKYTVALVTLTLTLVCQAADYEEVGYDDLVRQISARKKSTEIKTSDSSFDEVKIHTGLGYVNSFNEMRINDKSAQRYANGMQIAVGIDLFSDNWFGETCFRNFGLTTSGSEEMFLKEFDLKLGYQDQIRKPLSFRVLGGLANRYLTINDSVSDRYIDETTPMFMGSIGILSHLNPVLNMGLDFSARSALVNNSADRSSFDFTFTFGATL